MPPYLCFNNSDLCTCTAQAYCNYLMIWVLNIINSVANMPTIDSYISDTCIIILGMKQVYHSKSNVARYNY